MAANPTSPPAWLGPQDSSSPLSNEPSSPPPPQNPHNQTPSERAAEVRSVRETLFLSNVCGFVGMFKVYR